MGKEFTQKELDQIREIAIKGYVTEPRNDATQETLRLKMIVEATYKFLKQKGLIKDETTIID
jgi:hypothetical protein